MVAPLSIIDKGGIFKLTLAACFQIGRVIPLFNYINQGHIEKAMMDVGNIRQQLSNEDKHFSIWICR